MQSSSSPSPCSLQGAGRLQQQCDCELNEISETQRVHLCCTHLSPLFSQACIGIVDSLLQPAGAKASRCYQGIVTASVAQNTHTHTHKNDCFCLNLSWFTSALQTNKLTIKSRNICLNCNSKTTFLFIYFFKASVFIEGMNNSVFYCISDDYKKKNKNNNNQSSWRVEKKIFK